MVPHPDSLLGKFLKVVEQGRRASVLAFMMEHFHMSQDLAMDAIVMDNQPLLNHTSFIPSSVQERLRAWVESLERPMQVAMTPEELVSHIDNYIQTIDKTKPVPGPFMLGLDMAVGEPTPELEDRMDNVGAIALQIPVRVYKWYDALPQEAKSLLADLKQKPDGGIMTMGERIMRAYGRRTGKSEMMLKRAAKMIDQGKEMIRTSASFEPDEARMVRDPMKLYQLLGRSEDTDYKLDDVLQSDIGPGKLSFNRAKPTAKGGDIMPFWVTQLPPHMLEGVQGPPERKRQVSFETTFDGWFADHVRPHLVEGPVDERLGESRHQDPTRLTPDMMSLIDPQWNVEKKDMSSPSDISHLPEYLEKAGLRDVVVLDDTVYLQGSVPVGEMKVKVVYTTPEGGRAQMTVRPQWPLGTKAPSDDPRIVRDADGVIVGVKGPFSDAEVAEILKRFDESQAAAKANDTLGNSTSNITSAFGYPKE